MRQLSSLAVSSLALMQSIATGLTLPSPEVQIRYMRRSVNAQTQQELASNISSNSTIIGPTDPNWAYETERYMQNVKPQVQLLVRPGRESDVEKIVCIVISKANIVLTPEGSICKQSQYFVLRSQPRSRLDSKCWPFQRHCN